MVRASGRLLTGSSVLFVLVCVCSSALNCTYSFRPQEQESEGTWWKSSNWFRVENDQAVTPDASSPTSKPSDAVAEGVPGGASVFNRFSTRIKEANVKEGDPETEENQSKRQKTVKRKALLSVEGIEGYGERVLVAISDLIALPLRHPDMFRSIGVRPSCGIMLNGATGSGKSLLMEKCVEYLGNIHYQAVNGCDLLTKPPPEDGVKILERMFEVASKNAPSLIFVDNLEEISREFKTVVLFQDNNFCVRPIYIHTSLCGRVSRLN